MNRPPPSLEPIGDADIVSLAVEHWRLTTCLDTAAGNLGVARHAARRIGDILTRLQIEARSLDGMPFEAGLAAKVVDTIDDPALPAGTNTVDETIAPLVIRAGQVIRPAEVVVRRGAGASRK
ncbi:MAG TPA: hypothetical protein VHY37_12350 [Tepidisphaeraceae bacterium]|nr:hypothetical protein [Tepidisphaeraceae bacterium]